MNRLDPIVEGRRNAVVLARSDTPLEALRDRLPLAPAWRDFKAALLKPRPSIIAEIKRRSPSAGAIRPAARASQVAVTYHDAGARALSVLTEPTHFGGDLSDILAARDQMPLPVLRKDFIVDPYQILESRVAGADAVLLIVAVLGERTGEFVELAAEAGLDALVEVHDEEELRIALDGGAEIVGVNNRNLTSLKVDLSVAERLLPMLPENVVGVAESGVETREDAARLGRAGAQALLIGSALMRAENPRTKLREFLV